MTIAACWRCCATWGTPEPCDSARLIASRLRPDVGIAVSDDTAIRLVSLSYATDILLTRVGQASLDRNLLLPTRAPTEQISEASVIAVEQL